MPPFLYIKAEISPLLNESSRGKSFFLLLLLLLRFALDFSGQMDGIIVKSRLRKVCRKQIRIQRLSSMSITDDDKKTTTATTTTKKLRSKEVVPSSEPEPDEVFVDDNESTVKISDEEIEERTLLQCVSHGSISVCGRRREMEDTVSVKPGFLSEIDFFGVYDGHGGSRVAEECSEKLHKFVAEEMTMMMIDQRLDGDGDDWEKIFVSCFSKMDDEVSESKGEECGDDKVDDWKSIGSTAVVALIGKEKIIVANCGDSRAVMSRGGVAIPLSCDHKPDRADERERVESAGGRVINWNGYRVLGVLATSRSIGDYYLKPYVISVPEVLVTERTESDEFLILASDGLWDVLSNELVCDVARRCMDAQFMRKIARYNAAAANRLDDGATRVPTASNSNIAASRIVDGATRAATVLTELAMARGSGDNITVVVIELNKMT